MATYVKIGENQYEASITGRINDKDWDNRSSKAITVEMSYADAIKMFNDDIEWFILQDVEETMEEVNEETGEVIYRTVINTESYDNSEYSVAGSITDNRDGTITAKMGKVTAEELISMIEEAL